VFGSTLRKVVEREDSKPATLAGCGKSVPECEVASSKLACADATNTKKACIATFLRRSECPPIIRYVAAGDGRHCVEGDVAALCGVVLALRTAVDCPGEAVAGAAAGALQRTQ